MPRGGARVGAGRPKNPGPPKKRVRTRVKAAAKVKPAVPVVPEAKPDPVVTPPAPVGDHEDLLPLAYMLEVMNDPSADARRRDTMAVAAAPYLHPKQGEAGKKDQRNDKAKSASAGKFAPAAAPKLVVHNR
jgi:phage terminase small subunit